MTEAKQMASEMDSMAMICRMTAYASAHGSQRWYTSGLTDGICAQKRTGEKRGAGQDTTAHARTHPARQVLAVKADGPHQHADKQGEGCARAYGGG